MYVLPKVYSNFPNNPPLTFPLTTPPIPKAGMILHILAAALTLQFFFTIDHLSCHVMLFEFRLYKSRPKRCSGVLIICIPAGATNCATVCPEIFFCTSACILRFNTGPSNGGTLNDAKIVMQSRSVKSA